MNVATAELDDELVDWRYKGFPALPEGTRVSDFVADRPSLFDAGFSWPVMALRSSAIDNNIGVLARWCASSGISLAPHGKTTMAPALFARQIAAGAWAMTAATPWQVRAYRAFGVPRVLLANEVADPVFVGWLVSQLADPEFEFLCYVDSVAGVRCLGEASAAAAAVMPPVPSVAARPIPVLLELGVPAGRTGARTDAEARAVAEAVGRFPSLSLVGVAGYEGPLGHGRDSGTLTAVRAYVTRLHDLLQVLDDAGLLDARAREYVLTCGGSGHIDVVSSVLSRTADCARPVRPVLRSGSYITHDNGLYAQTSSLAAELRPAIEVWCQVWSRPEPGLVLLGAGRRDVPFDAGLPVPLVRRTSSGELTPLGGRVTRLNDQHAFLALEESAALEVGDLVCLGISHPCTAHDKWQLLPLIDDERRVIDCVRSYF
jgi:D-serine deaminase-like pyridoxal phosphate-dependent protein